MTSLPAQTFHIADRGTICPGAYADLVLFDAEAIRDEATFTDANRFPTGIDRVYVNGVLAVRDGTVLDARAGRVLRHGHRSSASLTPVVEAA
jgi:N-acyl-D-aspartate/D-glutamate deacylase